MDAYERIVYGDPTSPRPLCPETRKVRHASRASAKRHAKLLKRAGGNDHRTLHAYVCPFCEDFHVGHDRRRDR